MVDLRPPEPPPAALPPMPPPSRDPRLLQAAAALNRNDLDVAHPALTGWLAAHPDDPYALRMMAEVAGRLGRYGESERLLRQALAAAPAFDAARFNLALVLHRQSRGEPALTEIDALLHRQPDNPAFRNLKAAILARNGDHDAAITLYQALLARHPDNGQTWMSLGHALKTVGRGAECIAAYREAVTRRPSLGEAWWSLANLKTLRFTADDVAAMTHALGDPGVSAEDRFHLEFALGKALEDTADYAASFAHYARGNAGRRAMVSWNADGNREHVATARRILTREFFAARAGWGDPAADPIFVVGLPRSGSTLIEQILASHSTVEGTAELPELPAMARRLAEGLPGSRDTRYLDALAGLDANAVAALGGEYLDRTRSQRKTAKPRFIDKLPNNFAFTGLIHLMLPNATIIDARRHPMATGFSAWKQHFARGQTWSYDLGEIGRYYTDYVALMAHFDQVLPGRVIRVQHEALVADTEAEVRRLLAACGLGFEAACLAFHENTRAVRTASAEQVRRPISAEGIDHWRNYQPWLGDLKATLGPLAE